MSAIIYGNCLKCGQPFTVQEDTHSYLLLVGDKVVCECPVCGEELQHPYTPVQGEVRRTYATTKLFVPHPLEEE